MLVTVLVLDLPASLLVDIGSRCFSMSLPPRSLALRRRGWIPGFPLPVDRCCGHGSSCSGDDVHHSASGLRFGGLLGILELGCALPLAVFILPTSLLPCRRRRWWSFTPPACVTGLAIRVLSAVFLLNFVSLPSSPSGGSPPLLPDGDLIGARIAVRLGCCRLGLEFPGWFDCLAGFGRLCSGMLALFCVGGSGSDLFAVFVWAVDCMGLWARASGGRAC
ncbi:hypothetical protein Dimus_037276, partial [Dionaea muscipula]